MDAMKAAFGAILMVCFFVFGAFIGANVVAPAQADARAEIDGEEPVLEAVEVMPPTREQTRTGMLHALGEIDATLDGIEDRLRQERRGCGWEVER